jgi:ParB family chromosome partitioning protein
MKLDFIPLDKLTVAKVNMRAKGRDPDVSDIQPSIAKRGVIVPLLVRERAEADAAAIPFEILAGRRRFTAVGNIVRDGGTAMQLPCAILDEGDDADAIEASMLENLARVAPDEVTQWEAFAKLVKAGRKPEEIAADFAFEVRTVERILALGNLIPRIRSLYRHGEIDQTTVKQLTLATKSQQTAWLALFDDKDANCPKGFRIRDWLFGGETIKAAHALFDVEAAGVAIVADLFDNEKLVPDSDAFWTLQKAEVEARKAAYLADGWSDVVILERAPRFHSWEYAKTSKRGGGRVYIELHRTGEVEFHEGYLTEKEAAARARAEAGAPPERARRPEVTGATNNYIDLHRHAAVRAELAKHGGVALRALAAHVIASADHFRVDVQSQLCAKDEVQESVETCASEVLFDERRRAVLAVLGFDAEDETVTARYHGRRHVAPIFARLLELPDPVVLEIVAIVMGETLMAGSEAVEMIGVHLGIDMATHWKPDAAFWNLIRDKEVLGKMVAEVAGEEVAAANGGEKAKALKSIIADHLDGANGRTKVAPWVPKWMAFPPAAYTARGGVGSVEAEARMFHIMACAAEAEADAEEERARVAAESSPRDIDCQDVASVDADAEGEGGADECGEDEAPPLAA